MNLSILRNLRSRLFSFKLKKSRVLSFSIFFTTYFAIKYKSKSFFSLENRSQIIYLKKNDYYLDIIGNNKDYIFLIIYDNEYTNEAEKCSRKISEKFSDKKIYLITSYDYEDIKKTINRVKNKEIFQLDEKVKSIKILYKVPFSDKMMRIKFNEQKFYEKKNLKKLIKKINKIDNLIEIIDDENLLLKKLWINSLSDINSTLLIKCVSNENNEKELENFKKKVFNYLQMDLLTYDSNFLIIKNQNIKNKLLMNDGEIYILRNDILSKFNQIYNNNNNFIINFNNFLLEKKLENIKFAKFLLPRISFLKNAKKEDLTPFFRKISYNKEKYIFSYLVDENDIKNIENLAEFFNLYDEYKNYFNFLIINSKEIEDFLPHANPLYPKMCIFNFFNQEFDKNKFKNYYKNLVFPYEKYYIESNDENLKEKIKKILDKNEKKQYISNNEGNVQIINSDMIKNLIEVNNENNYLIEVGDEKFCYKQIFNDIAEKNTLKNLKFFRMNYLNQNKYLPIFKNIPTYIYIDNQKKEIRILELENYINKKIIENKIKEFIN